MEGGREEGREEGWMGLCGDEGVGEKGQRGVYTRTGRMQVMVGLRAHLLLLTQLLAPMRCERRHLPPFSRSEGRPRLVRLCRPLVQVVPPESLLRLREGGWCWRGGGVSSLHVVQQDLNTPPYRGRIGPVDEGVEITAEGDESVGVAFGLHGEGRSGGRRGGLAGRWEHMRKEQEGGGRSREEQGGVKLEGRREKEGRRQDEGGLGKLRWVEGSVFALLEAGRGVTRPGAKTEGSL